MKKTFTLFSLLTVLAGVAQPTIQQSNTGYETGTTLQLETSNTTFSVPDGGASVAWDYSSLQFNPAGTSTVSTYSGAPYAPANINVSSSTGSSYYTQSSSGIDLKAIVSSGTTIDYMDAQAVIAFPFTYGSEFDDTFTATFSGPGFSMDREGGQTITGHGYGSLTVNGVTITDVLCVKAIQTYTDTYMGTEINTTGEVYNFYKPGYHHALLSLNKITIVGPSAYSSVALSEGELSAIENVAKPAPCIYPNPATGNVTIVTEKGVDLVVISDLQGRRIEAFEHPQGRVQYSVSGLPKGIYLVTVRRENGATTTGKLIVE